MDEEVLEEGLTWKEIVHWLKDHPESPSWTEILLQVIERGSFPAVRRLKDGTLAIEPLDTSGKVLGFFLEKASDQPILGTRKS